MSSLQWTKPLPLRMGSAAEMSQGRHAARGSRTAWGLYMQTNTLQYSTNNDNSVLFLSGQSFKYDARTAKSCSINMTAAFWNRGNVEKISCARVYLIRTKPHTILRLSWQTVSTGKPQITHKVNKKISEPARWPLTVTCLNEDHPSFKTTFSWRLSLHIPM